MLFNSRLLIVCLGVLILPLDSSVNVAFPHITGHFGVPMAETKALVLSFVLTVICLMLVAGRAGDIWGYRRVFQAGLAVSVFAFILDGLAPSYGFLLTARMLQGVGSALVISCGPALALGLFDEAARGPVIGLYAMVLALGNALGPFLGGWLVEGWGWSAVFWYRVPIALSALAFSGLLPLNPDAEGKRGFDLLGAILLGVLLGTFFLAFNAAWSAPGWTLAFGAAAALAAIAFIRQQGRSPAPIIDLGLFKSWDFALLNLTSVLVNLACFSILLLVPFQFGRMTGLTAGAAGMALAVYPLGVALGSRLAGGLLGSGGGVSARGLARLGMAGSAAGLWLIGGWAGTSGVAVVASFMGFVGLGLGLFQAAYLFIVTGAIPPASRGVAGSLAELTRAMGILGAATTLFAVFQGLEAAGGFMAAFQTSFRLAATVPAVLFVLAMLGLLRRK